MKRLFYWLTVAALAVLLASGCTYDLWTQKPRLTTYTEMVGEILLANDNHTIALLTPKYHYLFRADPSLAQAIQAHFRNQLEAEFSGFRISTDQSVNGKLRLSLPATLDSAQQHSARTIGFLPNDSGVFQLDVSLHGERYAAGDVKLPAASQQALNRQYSVAVVADEGLSLMEKIKSTPIALIGDALVIGVIPLYPVGWLIKSLEE